MNSVFTWFRSLRAYSFPLSIFPVIIAFVFFDIDKNIAFYLTLFGISMIMGHAGTNVFNDYYDNIHEVDDVKSEGASGLIQSGEVSPSFMKKSGLFYFSISILAGIPIMIKRPIIILPASIALVLAFFYTNQKLSLKYKGMGEIIVLILFGIIPGVISQLIILDKVILSNLLLWLPCGLITASVMLINNIRDIDMDRKAGIKTLPMIIGKGKAMFLYRIFLLLSFFIVFISYRIELIDLYSNIVVLLLPFALYLMKSNPEKIKRRDVCTVRLYFLFMLLFLIPNMR